MSTTLGLTEQTVCKDTDKFLIKDGTDLKIATRAAVHKREGYRDLLPTGG